MPRATYDAEYRRLGLKDGFFEQYRHWLRDAITFKTFGPTPGVELHEVIP